MHDQSACWLTERHTPYRPEICCESYLGIELVSRRPVLVSVPKIGAATTVVLHVPRTGGTSFEFGLLRAVRKRNVPAVLAATEWNIVGTPLFAKFYPPTMRHRQRIVSGHYDWDLIGSDLLDPGPLACILTLREPVDAFTGL